MSARIESRQPVEAVRRTTPGADGERICFTCSKPLDPPRAPEEFEAEEEAKNEAARLAGEREDRQLGGGMFPLLLADAVAARHITRREYKMRLELHRRVVAR